MLADDGGALFFEPPEGAPLEYIDRTEEAHAREHIDDALTAVWPRWRTQMDRVASWPVDKQVLARAAVHAAIEEGNRRAAPRIVRVGHAGYELPLDRMHLPHDVLKTLCFGVIEKPFLSDADLGAAVVAIHDVLDLQAIFRRGMEHAPWNDLGNSALKWTLDALASWNGQDVAALGRGFAEMYDRLGLADSYAA